MDIRQSPKYCNFLTSLGWKVETIGKTKVFIRHLPFFPYFSVIKIQRFTTLNWQRVELLAKKHHALFVKLEPDSDSRFTLAGRQLQEDTWPLLPTKTIILDLKKIHVPSSVARAKKYNLKTIRSFDVEQFITLWEKNAKIRKFWSPLGDDIRHLSKAFKKDSHIFFTYDNEEIVSGIVVIGFRKTGHYFYAFSTALGRKKWAAYICLFDAIRFLKNDGYTTLDLEGVFDERFPKVRKSWQGFSDFKSRWNGKVVYYPNAFIWHRSLLIRLLFLLEKFI